MSNKEASKIYEAIVENVINEVREDFENAGIDEQTLQDLKRNWQSRLSETKVSKFSWDDLINNPIVSNNNNNNITNNSNNNSNNNDEFSIKQENNDLINPSANIHPDLGQGLVLPGFDSIPQPPTNIGNDIDSNNNDDDNNNNNNNNNNDISIKEENNLLPDPTADSSNNNNNIDNSEIQAENPPIDTTNGQIELTLEDPNGSVEEQLRLQEKKAKRSALLDTDEVGSELDDSDDDYLISEGEDDGPDENLMLCLYDKVTRTKARWKCSLKDGIVTINHKDYTFQKAQVEAEWV